MKITMSNFENFARSNGYPDRVTKRLYTNHKNEQMLFLSTGRVKKIYPNGTHQICYFV